MANKAPKKKPQSKPRQAAKKAAAPSAPNHWLVFGLLVVASLALYAQTYRFGYVLDDDVVYLHNKHVQAGVEGLPGIFGNSFIHGFTGNNDQSYRPLPLAMFALEHQVLGNNPYFQHFMNALLHGLCGFLLWLVLKRLFRNRHPAVPILMALLFVAHPVHTEVVANVKGRDDLLHFLFAISALYFALRYAMQEAPEPTDNALPKPPAIGGAAWLGLSALMLFMALLCKEVAITFLAVIPATLYFFTSANWKKIALTTLPLLAVLGLYMAIRASVLDFQTFEEDEMKVINNALAAANGAGEKYSTALMMVVMYIGKLFFPHPLSWEYGYNQIPIVSPTDWQALASFAVLIGLAVVAVLGIKNRNPLAWAIFFFVATISIVSNLVIEIGATFAERFVFTPSVAYSVAIVLLVALLTRTDLSQRKLLDNLKFVAPLALVLLFFIGKTWQRSGEWKSNDTLFLAALDAAPNSSRVWSAAGSVYRVRAEKATDPQVRKTNYDQAISHYLHSLEILDTNFDSWYNLGVSYHYSGRLNEAMEAYQKVVAIDSTHVNAWNNIGSLQFNMSKDYNLAKASFEKVVSIDSTHADALTNLGACYHNQGDLETAVIYYHKALAASPNNQNARNNLAVAYERLGKPEEAAKYKQPQQAAGR